MSNDAYTSRGYGAKSRDFGEKPGLVVADFQTDVTAPSFPMGGSRWSIAPWKTPPA